MSNLLSDVISSITPYTPGEQLNDKAYVKLNTNECPFPPSPKVKETLSQLDYERLKLYPDPTLKAVKETAAKAYNLKPEQIFVGCGSDEVLAHAFMAFFSKGDRVYFPDITYGFYKVYAQLFQLDAVTPPLKDEFTIDLREYTSNNGGVVIANPNAPTSIGVGLDEIENIIKKNPDNIVIIDEAYIDFSDITSATTLVDKYDNLLVCQTLSKSRALAGMRLGLGFGNPKIIDGLNRVKYSINPYNIDAVAQAVAVASLSDSEYLNWTVKEIVSTRETSAKALESLGFTVLKSQTNFLFARPKGISGESYYTKLREKGVLVRYFGTDRLKDYVRITVGSKEQMEKLIEATKEILKEEKS